MATAATTAVAALAQKMGSKYIIPFLYIKISALDEGKERAFIARVVCFVHAIRAFLLLLIFGRGDDLHGFAFYRRQIFC
jgi:hypothetical protein